MRHFHVINDIDRTHVPSFAPLVGIQKLHNITNTKKESTVICRAYSCFCNCCLANIAGCPNSHITGQAKEVKMEMKSPDSKDEAQLKEANHVTVCEPIHMEVVVCDPEDVMPKIAPLSRASSSNALSVSINSDQRSILDSTKETDLNHARPLSTCDVPILIEDSQMVACPTEDASSVSTNGDPQFILDSLPKCQTVDEMKAKLNDRENMLPELPRARPTLAVVPLGKSVDSNSLDLVPHGIPMGEERDLYPVQIYGDGNCLPRVASVFAYGDENRHNEMRLRMCHELITSKQRYLDETFYIDGRNPDTATNRYNERHTTIYAMCSPCFRTEQLTTYEGISNILDKVILQCAKTGEYCGIWPLASLANILKQSVVSVYPTYWGHNIRPYCHRVFKPDCPVNETGKAVHILWTNTTGRDKPPRTWSPNHFVPLLPLLPPVPPEIFITGDEDGRETSIQENDDSFILESIMADLSMCVEDIMETLDDKKLRADGSPKSTKPEASNEIQLSPRYSLSV